MYRRTFVSNVTRPTASCWWIIRCVSEAARYWPYSNLRQVPAVVLGRLLPVYLIEPEASSRMIARRLVSSMYCLM